MGSSAKKSEYLSAESKKLEDKIISMYGTKRGKAFIAAAKQDVDYELGSDNTQVLEWIKKYEAQLLKRI